MVEKWSGIKGCSKYSVSDQGRVMHNKSKRVLKPRPDSSGYLRVSLSYDDGHIYDKSVHRLVVDAFYDGDHTGLDVNHLDGRKYNNVVTNLEVCSRSDNLKHAYRTGLRESPHNRCVPIRIVETGEVFDSVRDCARHLGCSHGNISVCLAHRNKTCYGYHFEYI